MDTLQAVYRQYLQCREEAPQARSPAAGNVTTSAAITAARSSTTRSLQAFSRFRWPGASSSSLVLPQNHPYWQHALCNAFHLRDTSQIYAGCHDFPTIARWLHAIGCGDPDDTFVADIVSTGDTELFQVRPTASNANQSKSVA
jgi:hypothetical protein